MADERIDIEINDKIDANIPKKLRDIATNADKGESSVRKLKAALASINSSPASRLKEATDNVTNSLNRELNAQNRLTAATAKASIADAKAAVEKQRLATETERTAAARARAVAASARAQAAELSLAAAQARTAASGRDLASRADRLRSALDPLYAAQMRFNAEINEANTLLRTGAISMNTYQQAVAAADTRLKAAHEQQKRFNQGLATTGATGRMAGHHTANIAAQINDLGVQFAMAAQSGEPLKMVFMALIQQGSQLSYIASTMDGGWKGLTGTIVRMTARFLPLLAVLGVGFVQIKAFNDEINGRAEPYLREYANTLGLTADEMKKLTEETGGFAVNAGDMWSGFWATVKEGLRGFADEWAAVTGFVGNAWDTTMSFLRAAFVGFYGAVHTLIELLGKTFVNVFKIAANVIIGIFNAVVMSVQAVVNGVLGTINSFASGANAILGALGFDTVIPQIDRINLGVQNLTDNMYTLESMDIAGSMRANMAEADRTLRGFTQRWEANSIEAARNRMRDAANQIIEDRSPGASTNSAGPVDRTAERRAESLRLVNLELDNELDRMRLLKPEREIQQRMDQISQQLAQKGITLGEAERRSIEGKVRAIQEYAHIQEQADRIYEAAIAPQRTYNATLQATSQLLAQGAIDQATFNREVALAERALQEATNPLFAIQEAMAASEAATGRYGVALERHNYYEGIRQAMLQRGIVLSGQYVAGVNAEVDALMRRNDALMQQQYIQSQVAAIVDPILEDQRLLDNKAAFYAEIDRLRQQDVLSEEQAQRARLQMELRFQEMRLSAASDFFGSLVAITRGGHGAIGAISKAAAIAQATIDGYVAVQKALASAPPPWNYVAAAAVAIKTGSQVAGIISTNVGSYQDGGQFVVDGKAGVDRNNINMNVSRGERVTIETPAQQRAADSAASGGEMVSNTKVVNYFDEASFVAAMDSDEGERVIMNVIRRNGSQIARMAGGDR